MLIASRSIKDFRHLYILSLHFHFFLISLVVKPFSERFEEIILNVIIRNVMKNIGNEHKLYNKYIKKRYSLSRYKTYLRFLIFPLLIIQR